MDDVFATVRQLLVDEHVLGLNALTGAEDDTPLLDSGRMKSVTVIRVVAALEARLQVRLGPDEITPENLQSISSMARLLERKRHRPASTA
jgi:acyl carrier protein